MALPEPDLNGEQNKKAADQDDKDFHPTAEMMIHDMDDERTLEEEEALDKNGGAKVQEELDDLRKESEMPIEELLAYYERMRNESSSNLEERTEEGEEYYDGDDGDDDDDDDEEDEDDDDDEGGASQEDRAKKRKEDPDDPGDDQSTKRHRRTPPNLEPDTHDLDKDQTSEQSRTSGKKQISDRAWMEQDSIRTMPISGSSTATAHGEIDQKRNDSKAEGSGVPESIRKRHRPTMRDFLLDDNDCDVFTILNGYEYDDSNSSMDEDYSCSDEEDIDDERDWRRIIHVGSDFQADVPEGLREYGDVPPYENEDELVWKCNPDITHEQILDYLKQASALSRRNDISISPASVPKISNENMRLYRERMQNITTMSDPNTIEHYHENSSADYAHTDNLQDVYMSQSRKRMRIDYELEQENAIYGIGQSCGVINRCLNTKENSGKSASRLSTEEYFHGEEQLLYLLLKCNHNFDEAIRRRKLDPLKYYILEPMSLWSQDECLSFEHGLKAHGKNFRLIREEKVPTRTHAEIVAFYYLWKKSERHDVYTNQYKLDRKRCLSHPGTTDYMDKFIEDSESSLIPNVSTSTTPIPATLEEMDTHPQKEYLVVKESAHIQ